MSRISVVGGLIMDIKGFPQRGAHLFNANPGRIHYSPGGVGRNIAENLARLKIPVSMFGLVGEDLIGDRLLQSGRIAGIDITGVKVEKGVSSAVDMQVLQEDGDLWVSVTDLTILQNLRVEDLEPQADSIFDARYLVADANLRPEVLQYLLTEANRRQLPFIVDPVSIQFTAKINALRGKVFLATPNEQEYQCWEKPVDKLLISCGSAGVRYLSDSEEKVFPAISVDKLVDTIGAGDAFLAGVVAGLWYESDISRAIRWGQAVAALTLQTEETVCSELAVDKVRDLL